MESERIETLVIGGGQAGPLVGYHLAKRGRPFLILDANQRIGDSWRQRWDSLRLFTPARWDGLDGMPFPAPSQSFPTKDAMADYLESYAAHFQAAGQKRECASSGSLATEGSTSRRRALGRSSPTTSWSRCPAFRRARSRIQR
jgi:hypothetical protein